MGFRTSCLVLSLFLSSVAMAEGGVNGAAKPEEKAAPAAVHIVHTRRPEGVDPDDHNIRTLTSVLGSEEAAKHSLIYSYTTAASGFAAKLTPEQAEEILSGLGVLLFGRQLHCKGFFIGDGGRKKKTNGGKVELVKLVGPRLMQQPWFANVEVSRAENSEPVSWVTVLVLFKEQTRSKES